MTQQYRLAHTGGGRRWRARLRQLAGCAALTVAAACPDSPAPGEPPAGSLGVSISARQRLAQGGTAVYTATVQRTRYDGAVTLSAPPADLPDGVTVEFDPQVLPAGVSQTIIRVSASTTTPVEYVSNPSTTFIPVLAAAPGLSTHRALLSVQLVPSALAGITVQVAPPDIRTLLGAAAAEALVTIQRQGNYRGTVRLSVTGGSTADRGIEAAVSPVAGVPDTWLLRVTQTDLTRIVANGEQGRLTGYALSLRAEGDGLSPVLQQINTYIELPHIDPTVSRAPTIAAGQQDTLTVRIGRSAGMTGPVTLSTFNVPDGVTVTFDQNPSASDAIRATVAVSGNVAPGPYVFSVIATPTPASRAREATGQVQLTVLPRPTYTLFAPNVTLDAGRTQPGTFTIARTGGFAAPVTVSFTTATGGALPSGMVITLERNPLADVPEQATVMTVRTAVTTPVGTYNLRAVGSAGSAPAVTAPFTVTVTPSPTGSAVTRVIIDPYDAHITMPARPQFTARLLNASGETVAVEPGGQIEWTTAQPAVATIDANGLARGEAPGVTSVVARYRVNGTLVATDGTNLTVHAAGSAGHYGSATFSSQGNVRTLRQGESVLFQIIVRNTAGTQITSGVTPAPVVTSSNPGVVSIVSTVGPGLIPGYFYDMTAAFAAPIGSEVRIRYDVTGAGGEVIIRIVP